MKIGDFSKIATKNIGKDTRIWNYVNILDDVKIGNDCNICDYCYIESGVVIGNNVTIKSHISIWTGIEIEDDVFLGPNVVFTNDLTPRSKQPVVFKKTLIKKGASIGANSTILCGITIGEYAMTGIGSVVTRDIPGFSLAYGNPAKVVSNICKCGKEKLRFDNSTRVQCSCGLSYKKSDGVVSLL